jgi:hypothetical protein
MDTEEFLNDFRVMRFQAVLGPWELTPPSATA